MFSKCLEKCIVPHRYYLGAFNVRLFTNGPLPLIIEIEKCVWTKWSVYSFLTVSTWNVFFSTSTFYFSVFIPLPFAWRRHFNIESSGHLDIYSLLKFVLAKSLHIVAVRYLAPDYLLLEKFRCNFHFWLCSPAFEALLIKSSFTELFSLAHLLMREQIVVRNKLRISTSYKTPLILSIDEFSYKFLLAYKLELKETFIQGLF